MYRIYIAGPTFEVARDGRADKEANNCHVFEHENTLAQLTVNSMLSEANMMYLPEVRCRRSHRRAHF